MRSKQDKILVSLYKLPQVCGASLGGTQHLLYVQVGLAKGTRDNEITAMIQGRPCEHTVPHPLLRLLSSSASLPLLFIPSAPWSSPPVYFSPSHLGREWLWPVKCFQISFLKTTKPQQNKAKPQNNKSPQQTNNCKQLSSLPFCCSPVPLFRQLFMSF